MSSLSYSSRRPCRQRHGRSPHGAVAATARRPARSASVRPGRRTRPRAGRPAGSPDGRRVPVDPAPPQAGRGTSARRVVGQDGGDGLAVRFAEAPAQPASASASASRVSSRCTSESTPTGRKTRHSAAHVISNRSPASRQASRSASSGPHSRCLSRSSQTQNGSPVSNHWPRSTSQRPPPRGAGGYAVRAAAGTGRKPSSRLTVRRAVVQRVDAPGGRGQFGRDGCRGLVPPSPVALSSCCPSSRGERFAAGTRITASLVRAGSAGMASAGNQ